MARQRTDPVAVLRNGAGRMRADALNLENHLTPKQRAGILAMAKCIERVATDFAPLGESMLDLPYARDLLYVAAKWSE